MCNDTYCTIYFDTTMNFTLNKNFLQLTKRILSTRSKTNVTGS